MDSRPFEPVVLRPHTMRAVDRGSGARTTPLVTRAIGATSFLNGITSFDPGAAIDHHFHNCVESVMVIAGSALVDIDGVERRVVAGEVTFVPGNVPHHFVNASDVEPMRIFWTYGALEATRTLTESGLSRRIDEEHGVSDGAGGVYVEMAELTIRPGLARAFEGAVAEAAPLFQRSPGCRTFELVACEESKDEYRLLVEWTTLEDHTIGFRESADFGAWRALVIPYLAFPPLARHFRRVVKAF